MSKTSLVQVVSRSLVAPGVVVLSLLMLPLPEDVERAVVKLCDAALFWRPHPQTPVSMFWLIVGVCSMALGVNAHEYRNLTKQEGQFKPKFAVEVKLKLVTRERNCWVSAFSLLLVVVIHRFRHLVKRDLGKRDE